MDDTFLTIADKAQGIYKDKGSKFLAFAHPVNTEEQVKELVAGYRKQYFDARHHCYAYMLGAKKTVFRSSDDGEPSGTAGRPILGQIQSNQLTNILIVVVRYFGGVLLGTSGLIQAYKLAAVDVINNSSIKEEIVLQQFEVTFPYELMNEVMRVLKDNAMNFGTPEYTLACKIGFGVRQSRVDLVCTKLKKIEGINLNEIEMC